MVVPSVPPSRVGSGSGTLAQAYEERFLFLLLLLRQPRLRMIYVTSLPVDPRIIEYYLALLPGVIPSHARSRLSMVSVGDASPRALTQKLLERPAAAREDRRADPGPEPLPPRPLRHDRPRTRSRPHPRHPDVRRRPRLAALGTKTGAVASSARSASPIRSARRTCTASTRSSTRSATCSPPPHDAPGHREAQRRRLGSGNALVDLDGISGLRGSERRPAIAERVRSMRLESPTTAFETYAEMLESDGASWRSASSARSSSVRACSCARCPTARSSCCPRTTSSSAAPAARATSAACSPPIRRTRG